MNKMVILCEINIYDCFFQIYKDLHKFTQIVLKFKTCNTCFLKFRTISSDNLLCFGLIDDQIC